MTQKEFDNTYVKKETYEGLLDAARTVTWLAFASGLGMGVAVAAVVIGRYFL
tara:strand:+ start:378 stop:533 length:156 start_codon:yes stop_codon:yes gene_type:complete